MASRFNYFIKYISLLILITVLLMFHYGYCSGQERLKLAVPGLKAEGVPQEQADTVTEYLRKDLVNTNRYEVVERASIEQILTGQGIQHDSCIDIECAVKLGSILNVQKVLAGSVIKLNKTYYINVQLVDVETAKVEKSARQDCQSENDLEKISMIVASMLTGSKIQLKQPGSPGTDSFDRYLNSKYEEWKEAVLTCNRGIWSSIIRIVVGGVLIYLPVVNPDVYDFLQNWSLAIYPEYFEYFGVYSIVRGTIAVIKNSGEKKKLIRTGKEIGWSFRINRRNDIMFAVNLHW